MSPGTDAPQEQHSSPQALRGRLVLVVEDHPDHRELLRLHLEDEGALVKEASDAHEALATLGTSVPDLVITDINMPGEDGVWLLDRVRQLRPRTAIVALTGVWDTEAALRAGFDAFVPKPVKIENLLRVARRALAARSGADDAPAT
jgi:CheY-like chemotaxis protein